MYVKYIQMEKNYFDSLFADFYFFLHFFFFSLSSSLFPSLSCFLFAIVMEYDDELKVLICCVNFSFFAILFSSQTESNSLPFLPSYTGSHFFFSSPLTSTYLIASTRGVHSREGCGHFTAESREGKKEKH